MTTAPFSILRAQCGSRLPMDFAEISFELPPSTSIYGKNEGCFECADILLASSSDNMCTQIYTPHKWLLRAVNNSENKELARCKHSFGEHGRYNATLLNSINTEFSFSEISPATDTFKPLWVAILVIAMLALAWGVLCFLDAPRSIYRWFEQNKFIDSLPDDSSEAQLSKKSAAVSKVEDQENPLLTNLISDSTPTDPNDELGGISSLSKNSKHKKVRLVSLDAFRGITLSLMIFVNYDGGGYWFFNHSAWNGLTVADLLFPWFIFMMGVSMYLSFKSLAKVNSNSKQFMWRVVIRSAKLFAIGLFLNNGWQMQTWRVPGVLQYFGVAYLVTASTVTFCSSLVLQIQTNLNEARSKELVQSTSGRSIGSAFLKFDEPGSGLSKYLTYGDLMLLSYWPEWIVQALILMVYLSVHLGAKAPGCPRGYNGPGGIGDDGDHPSCTGGIHRHIDAKIFGPAHFYQDPTCKFLYDCQGYDPEGALGALTACTVTYIGLMAGRVLAHHAGHRERIIRWVCYAFVLLLFAGILCGFRKDGGPIPVNKNLWSTSFGLVTSGGGVLMLAITYWVVDVKKSQPS